MVPWNGFVVIFLNEEWLRSLRDDAQHHCYVAVHGSAWISDDVAGVDCLLPVNLPSLRGPLTAMSLAPSRIKYANLVARLTNPLDQKEAVISARPNIRMNSTPPPENRTDVIKIVAQQYFDVTFQNSPFLEIVDIGKTTSTGADTFYSQTSTHACSRAKRFSRGNITPCCFHRASELEFLMWSQWSLKNVYAPSTTAHGDEYMCFPPQMESFSSGLFSNTIV